MSSLRRGHANLLCIVPILADDLFRGSTCQKFLYICMAKILFGKVLWRWRKKRFKRGRAGIEPATSPTRRENHTSRPTALVLASNEDRTRDLVLTRHMLCQLSYRGDVRTALPVKNCFSSQTITKGLHRYGNCYSALGASNPSLAAAGCFPCSVAGLRRCHPRQCPRDPELTLKPRWQPQP